MKSQQKTLLGLAALFLTPLVAALVLFFGPSSWYPEPATAGVLISPAQPLQPLVLKELSGATVELEALKGRWILVYPQSTACNSACEELLAQLVQLQTALGEDRHRLSLLFVVAEPPEELAAFESLARKLPRQQVLLETAGEPGLLDQLGWRAELDRMYLVDALGNYLMYYPAAEGPRSVLSDLEHLMKHSANG